MSEPRKLRVYVAGAWVEKEHRAMQWISKLREAGVEITHDWTVDDVPCTPRTDADLPYGERDKRARLDLRGVHSADLTWLLAPYARGASGAWTEFGYALACQYQAPSKYAVVVSGESWQRTIFTSQACAGSKSDQDMFECILGMRETFFARVLRDIPRSVPGRLSDHLVADLTAVENLVDLDTDD